MVSISGVRGVVGESLTPDVVVRYAAAFGEYCRRRNPHGPEVIMVRDGRTTGKIMANLISSTLLSTGVHVRTLGICPTPTVQLAVEETKAVGGISVTASHNPIEWNGMKFIGSSGMFLDAGENRELWGLAGSDQVRYAGWKSIGVHTPDDSWPRKHIDVVLSLPYIDRQQTQRRRFRVVVDCINASGGRVIPVLLQELGCTVVEMNCDVSGVFAHAPEPVPENLGELAERVRAERADLGIAVDPDADRLVLVTEQGEPFGEEYTIASAVKFVLEKEASSGRRHRVVVNLSTTRAVEDIAALHGAEVLRTPVGEINVAKLVKSSGAIIGGEGSGGVILPAAHLGRDSLVGIALILQMLAEFGGPISKLKTAMPRYSIAKGKIDVRNLPPDAILEKVRSLHDGAGVLNNDDGLKIDYPDYWVHLRKSNTEPIIRIIAEAKTMERATAVVQEFRHLISSFRG